MRPGLRKAVLTTHVATSVGWLGAVVAYLALDLATRTSEAAATVRAAYVAMDLTVTYAIVPLASASLVVGIVNAAGTPWGLFRHYWVLTKLLLTTLAVGILLVEAGTVGELARMSSATDPRGLPSTLPHSIGGSVVLLVVTVLSVYKPRGLTRYGWRKQQEQRRPERTAAVP